MARAGRQLAHRLAQHRRRGGKKRPLGSGQRFAQLKGDLGKRGARNPGALAAYIGRQKYGSKRFAQLSRGGRRS